MSVFEAAATTDAPPSPLPLFRWSDVTHVERLIDTGRLVRVRRGIYAEGSAWRALAPWDRYLARVHAVALADPSSVFCYESAAVLQGLPVVGDPIVVHVLAAADGTSRARAGVRVHTARVMREIVEVGGILLSSPIDTAVDLARMRHPAYGLAVSDAALRQHTTLTVEMLVAANESRPSTRGRRIARWALHRACAEAESTLESLSRAAIDWLGFLAPELQMTFRSARTTDRVDHWWATIGVAGEADGDLKYDGRYGDPREVVRAERERERRLRAHGVHIVRWGWSDVRAVAPLRQLLMRAGVPRVGAEQPVPLRALGPLMASGAAMSSPKQHAPPEAAGTTRHLGGSVQSRGQ